MKHFAKILALGAAFVAAAPLAHADSLTGTIVTVDSVTVAANGQVTFSNPGMVSTAAQGNAPTGSFAGLAGDSVTFNNFNYTTIATPFLLYSGTDASLGAFSFTLSTGSCSAVSPSFPQYFNCFGTGIMSLGANTPTVVNYALGTNQSGTLNFSETNITAAAPTPEPSSLVMLGTGLVSAAGMLVRRRRIV